MSSGNTGLSLQPGVCSSFGCFLVGVVELSLAACSCHNAQDFARQAVALELGVLALGACAVVVQSELALREPVADIAFHAAFDFTGQIADEEIRAKIDVFLQKYGKNAVFLTEIVLFDIGSAIIF